MRLSSIWHYPIKSCQGKALATALLDPYGIEGDRLFVIAGLDGKALSQRTLPRLNLVSVDVNNRHVRLAAPGKSDLVVSLSGSRTPVTVDLYGAAPGECMGPEAIIWLTELLDRPCRLVRNHQAYPRHVYPMAAHLFLPVQLRYPDCAPILLVGQSSLDDLNARVETPLEMSRFRPNLVVSGAEAYEEDRWRIVRIGNVTLEFMGPCERCGVTLVIPGTEKRGYEPLVTLRTYRKIANGLAGGILFGAYFKPTTPGLIKSGDEVEVIESEI